MKYLFDTSFLVDYYREKEFARDYFLKIREDEIFISSVTLGELYYGAYKSDKPSENVSDIEMSIEDLSILVLNYDPTTAKEYGKLFSSLEKKGEKIPVSDSIIAATAKVNDCTILSTDQKHFTHLDNYGIKVEILGNNS